MPEARVKALIPIRQVSERVPGKNVRPLQGRPCYEWIVEALIASRYVEQVVINTDSEEVARGAERMGAKILWRPDYLHGRHVSIRPLIEHDLGKVEGEYFLQTHATNPLVTTATIDAAVAAFFAPGDHDSLFTVTPIQARFYWPDGRPVNHDPRNMLRTQDLPPIFEENSCLYVFSRATFERYQFRIGPKPIMFPMAPEQAVDIDEPLDFAVADALMGERLKT